MRKLAILTQRTRELEDGSKKKLWALVSKTRKDNAGRRRVLRWFGQSKPSSETVAQAERDIHGNANSADDITRKFDISKADFPPNLDLSIEAKSSVDLSDRKREIFSFYKHADNKVKAEKSLISRRERAIKTAGRVKKLKIDMPRGFKDWLIRRLGSDLDWAENKYAGAMAYLRSLPQDRQERLKDIFLNRDGTKATVETDSETITLEIGEHYPRQRGPNSLRPRAKEVEELVSNPRPIQLNLFD